MDKYKEQLNKIAFSGETYKKIEAIGKKHNINLDQEGELSAEIRDTILGIHPAHRFTSNIQERLEIDATKAADIARDVDEDIFKAIKTLMLESLAEKPQTPARPDLNMITAKKEVPFIVEKRPQSASPLYNDSALKKENVLNDLENIEKLKPQNASNFVEHLLANPVSKPTQVETKKVQSSPPASKSTVDPYREPV